LSSNAGFEEVDVRGVACEKPRLLSNQAIILMIQMIYLQQQEQEQHQRRRQVWQQQGKPQDERQVHPNPQEFPIGSIIQSTIRCNYNGANDPNTHSHQILGGTVRVVKGGSHCAIDILSRETHLNQVLDSGLVRRTSGYLRVLI
jgi:hypothetical protein